MVNIHNIKFITLIIVRVQLINTAHPNRDYILVGKTENNYIKIFTLLCNPYHHPSPEHFSSCKTKLSIHWTVTPYSPLFPATGNHYSIFCLCDFWLLQVPHIRVETYRFVFFVTGLFHLACLPCVACVRIAFLFKAK